MQKNLAGKKAIITGANQGLGLEIARKFVLAGADLMLCARDDSMLQNARSELARIASVGQKVVAQVVDVSVYSDVQDVVAQTLKQLGGCHILVNNAGVYGPKGQIESVDWVDWMKTIEINLYGSVLTSRAVLPHFKAQGYGKLIQLAGGGSSLPYLSAYAVSKTAVVRYVETIAEEAKGTGIDINCIAPGFLNTRMLDEILQAGPEIVGADFFNRAVAQREAGGVPLSKGSSLALFLASHESDGITGKLISAVWDNWSEWPNHRGELASSDVYTLRRITGRDRGFNWGDK